MLFGCVIGRITIGASGENNWNKVVSASISPEVKIQATHSSKLAVIKTLKPVGPSDYRLGGLETTNESHLHLLTPVQKAFADWVNREKQRPTRLWIDEWRPPTRSEITAEKQKRMKLASGLQEVVISLHRENRIAYFQKGTKSGDDQNHVHRVKMQICCS